MCHVLIIEDDWLIADHIARLVEAAGAVSAAVGRIVAALGEMPVLFVTGEPRAFQPGPSAMRVLHKPVDDRMLVATFRAIAPLP